VNLLVLELNIEGRNLSFELRPGQKLRFGRSKAADLLLESRSVSSLHLEFEWSGTIVILRDLDSRFGSFIEDEKERFRERQFTPLDTKLKVKIGKIKVDFTWRAEQLPLEKTEVLEENATRTKTQKNATLRYNHIDQKPTETHRTNLVAKTISAGQWSFSVLSLMLALFLKIFFWSRVLSPLNNLDPFMMISGASLDLLFFHRLRLDQFFILIVILLIIPCLGLRYFSKKRLPVYLDWSFFLSKKLSRVFCYFLLILSIFWPSISALLNGNLAVSKLSKVQEFYSLYKSGELKNISSDRWNLFAEELVGSSFVFGQYFNFRVEKVRSECARQDVGDWEKQKLCVALFFAAAIETTGQIKPAYLFEMANRIALIAAIDGMIRVLRQEGKSMDSLTLYFETLGNMGLNNEKDELLVLLRNQNLSDEKLLSSLFVLRSELDTRLMARQVERSIPEFMRLKAIDLLNIGF
jgi:hypothetical protein